MTDELERIWKEAIVVYFKVSSRRSLGGSEENHEKTQLREAMPRP
jgi:hypothetical protein